MFSTGKIQNFKSNHIWCIYKYDLKCDFVSLKRTSISGETGKKFFTVIQTVIDELPDAVFLVVCELSMNKL